jgi:hypothetical protein
METCRSPLENIHRDERVALSKAGLEDGWGIICDRLACSANPFLHGVMRQVDQDTTGKQSRRQFSDCVTLIEPVLQHLVWLELNGAGLVDLPPEELEALHSRDEA